MVMQLPIAEAQKSPSAQTFISSIGKIGKYPILESQMDISLFTCEATPTETAGDMEQMDPESTSKLTGFRILIVLFSTEHKPN